MICNDVYLLFIFVWERLELKVKVSLGIIVKLCLNNKILLLLL